MCRLPTYSVRMQGLEKNEALSAIRDFAGAPTARGKARSIDLGASAFRDWRDTPAGRGIPDVRRGRSLRLHDDSHRLTLYQRAMSRALDILEGWIVPALPRGWLRRRLRDYIDRAQARLKAQAMKRGER
jgi:hypothetical protein